MDPTHPSQIERADRWFARYGNWAVLFGRLVPFVRAFVSLPAGVSKMPLLRFSVLSLIGTIPWVLALALAGDAVGSEWTKIRSGFEYVDYVIVIAVVAAIVWALVRRRRGPGRAQAAGQTAEESGVEVVATHPGTDTTG